MMVLICSDEFDSFPVEFSAFDEFFEKRGEDNIYFVVK